MSKYVGFLLAFALFVTVGCGSGGGVPGDENDPETNKTDDAQMDDETGEVEGNN